MIHIKSNQIGNQNLVQLDCEEYNEDENDVILKCPLAITVWFSSDYAIKAERFVPNLINKKLCNKIYY